MPCRVVVATQQRALGGIETFGDSLVDGLCREGTPATRLLTEEDGPARPPPFARGDVPTERLGISRWATWRQRWEALRRHLEARAPCIYVPNDDAHHS